MLVFKNFDFKKFKLLHKKIPFNKIINIRKQHNIADLFHSEY